MSAPENRKTTSAGGFSLVEMAAILVISSLVLTAVLGLIRSQSQQTVLETNKQRLDAIQNALTNYQKQRSRLPCPASFTDAMGAATFGRERNIPCNLGMSGTYNATGRVGSTDAYGGNSATGRIIIGAVPVRDLGLPDSYVADAYGHRFTYAITQSATTAPLNPFAGAIRIVDIAGNSILPAPTDGAASPNNGTALYVVVDHGKDGKGAFMNGSATPKACGAATPADYLNCSYQVAPAARYAFRQAPFRDNPTPAASWFDDTIVYKQVTPSACSIVTSAQAGPGASSGYTMAGYDDGWGSGTGIGAFGFMVFVFAYENILQFAPHPSNRTTFINSPAPTAAAYCPAGFNVITGGCTQTYNGQPFGSDVKADSDEQIVMPPQSHPTFLLAQQGWQCHGSSALNLYTQAYAVCCP